MAFLFWDGQGSEARSYQGSEQLPLVLIQTLGGALLQACCSHPAPGEALLPDSLIWARVVMALPGEPASGAEKQEQSVPLQDALGGPLETVERRLGWGGECSWLH